MIINGKEEELEIEYPCNWSYKIITDDFDNVEEIVLNVVGARSYSLNYSHTSKNGRYKSYNCELLVHHDDDRLTLFDLFKKHPNIKMVL